MNFSVNDEEILEKYNRVWDKIKNLFIKNLILKKCIIINA